MSEPDTELPRGQLFEEAAAWFARMRGPDAVASRGDFEAWLARGALHRSAYNRAAEIFAMGKLLQDHEAEGAETDTRPECKRALVAGTVAAICLVFGAGWIGLGHTGGPRRDSVVAEQRPDETRPLELASQKREGAVYRLNDGSIVTLAAATRLRVDMTREVRRLVLEAGEGRFNVAHERRPFIVYAGGGSVTARGTVFDVALSPDRRIRVRLIEGVIEVAVPDHSPALRRQRLVTGQSTSFVAQTAPGGAAQQSVSPGGGAQAAEAVQEYDRVRMSDLIEAANRSSKRPIRLSAALGERRVSGRFRIDDTELLADRIAALFDLIVDRSNPSVILLRPRASRKI
jgi:transmembrane sensor